MAPNTKFSTHSKIYGRWPGLATSELYQERDLAVTTDFREPIAAVLQSHMQLTDSHIDKVFPRRPRQRGNLTGIIRA